MNLTGNSRPRLRAGCRFSENQDQENVLLIPEGLIKVAGPGRKVLELCDGTLTFTEIVSSLHSVYPSAAFDQIERETASFLESLRERGAVEY